MVRTSANDEERNPALESHYSHLVPGADIAATRTSDPLRTVTALTHSQTTFLGVVITHWDNLKLSQNFEDLFLPSALQEFGGEAFKVKIPLDNRLEYLEPGAQIPGAKAYEALAIEVLNAAKWPIVHVGQ